MQCPGVTGVIPAHRNQGDKMEPETDTGSISGVSLGSDAVSTPWYTEQSSLDMHMCCNLVCMALAVLHRMKRYHTVVQVVPLHQSALCSFAELLVTCDWLLVTCLTSGTLAA